VKLEPPVSLPRKEFTHSVLHLADNAFKFSKQNGRVGINVRSTMDGGVVVDIKDEGIGIPKELQDKVFERFYQVSQGDSRNYDGLGVGLTITKAITETLGGHIEFLETEAGCHVRMTIPGETQGNCS
jgi:signal transduction histidine kinase